MWAWGRLWVWWPMSNTPSTSVFRAFITPTITWAVWWAICFGQNTMWYIPPPWAAPVITWWNCIVAAKPMSFCSWDGSDWDPTSLWTPIDFWWWFWVINWNCNAWSSSQNNLPETNKIDTSFVRDYLEYKNTWIQSWNLGEEFINLIWRPVSNNPWAQIWINTPLFSVWWWTWNEFSVWLDLASLVITSYSIHYTKLYD